MKWSDSVANKTYQFEVTYAWAEEGNRNEEKMLTEQIAATTVPRAISKLVKELKETGDIGSSADILVVEVKRAERRR